MTETKMMGRAMKNNNEANTTRGYSPPNRLRKAAQKLEKKLTKELESAGANPAQIKAIINELTKLVAIDTDLEPLSCFPPSYLLEAPGLHDNPLSDTVKLVYYRHIIQYLKNRLEGAELAIKEFKGEY